jgi:hypothetical protein
VPASFSDATFYRAQGPADPADGESGGVYNIITGLNFSKDKDCYNLEKFPDGGEAVGSMGKYVAEEAGEDTSITTLYVKDDAGWGSVFFYGWGEFDDSDTLAGTKVSGQTNVWKFELPIALVPGSETFLLKATAGKKDWSKKTDNLALEEGMNMYSLKSGTWSKFNG